MTSSHFIILIIASPLLTAFLLPLISRIGRKAMNLWSFFSLAIIDIFAFSLYRLITEKGTVVYSVGAKLPSLTTPAGFPIRIILVGDALSGLLALIFLFVASLVFLHSLKTLNKYSSLDKFYTLYFLLMIGILGFLFVGDFFTLFVFYEINTIATTGLIAFFGGKKSLSAAFHYLAVFAVGSLFLLLGIGLFYSQYGFLNMAAIASNIHFSFLNKIVLSFIASALLLKIGVFPFYFWKPEAYKISPIPAVVLSIISSLSALYALFRIAFDIFGLNVNFGWILVLFSILSIFAGVFLALKEKNVKGVLAYLAISELGYIILGISSGYLFPNTKFGFNAIQGGLFHIINEILDMGLLFLSIGIIAYTSKQKDISKIRGIAHYHPIFAGFFLLGILAVSGIPPLNSFASKIMIYESIFRLNPILTVIGISGSILTLAVLVKVFASIFLGEPTENYRSVPRSATIVIFVFAISMILIGLFPRQFITSFISPAAKALISQQNYINAVRKPCNRGEIQNKDIFSRANSIIR